MGCITTRWGSGRRKGEISLGWLGEGGGEHVWATVDELDEDSGVAYPQK